MTFFLSLFLIAEKYLCTQVTVSSVFFNYELQQSWKEEQQQTSLGAPRVANLVRSKITVSMDMPLILIRT